MATTVFNVNFVKDRADSTLRIIVYANLSSPDDIQFTAYILLDGSIAQTCVSNIILDTSSSQGKIPLSPFAYLNGIAAGSHNIQLSVANQESDNVALTILKGATIEIAELKQGAT